MTRRLWLVRHAVPLVAPGLCYGALDVPADLAATADAARRLAQALPHALAAAFHSPLQRCEQLAHALIAPRPDLACEPDGRIAEMDFGAWEGRPWDAIARADIDAWTQRFPDPRPSGGDSLAAMLQRVGAALDEARKTSRDRDGDVLWITHAGVARCVQWLQAEPGRMPRADEWPIPAPGYGEWMTVPLGDGTSGAIAEHRQPA
ncbi:histidine phosphatase family protein [Acidovorax sp. SUPP3334]|uniref:histidine phosphatase family protein n=1 Tax=Acidovorax sp. SUPP3334 TaxID=2920881 RepID=UPI0023DE3253|nr:histidine phosphatase family protein [Acidovorax sp. SUPP3334]GKT23641.1 histidine phosphatase family protein [Acidovorax sp. SUPP3334]